MIVLPVETRTMTKLSLETNIDCTRTANEKCMTRVGPRLHDDRVQSSHLLYSFTTWPSRSLHF